MDKTLAKKLIADNIYAIVGFKKIQDCRTLYDMSKFFKDNGIHFVKGDIAIDVVAEDGRPIARAVRKWSQHRVCLEYKELKPQIEWYV